VSQPYGPSRIVTGIPLPFLPYRICRRRWLYTIIHCFKVFTLNDPEKVGNYTISKTFLRIRHQIMTLDDYTIVRKLLESIFKTKWKLISSYRKTFFRKVVFRRCDKVQRCFIQRVSVAYTQYPSIHPVLYSPLLDLGRFSSSLILHTR
jgi:hypothetical protein